MKREIYQYLEKYSIYNPCYIPPDFSFDHAPQSLRMNEKFVFLVSKVQSYFSTLGKNFKNKSGHCSGNSEEWKRILYRTLHGLLTEVSLCTSGTMQNEMLLKIQSWYFNKIHVPGDGVGSCNKPIVQSFIESSKVSLPSLVPRHKKSCSVDSETKVELMNDYKQSIKDQNLSFGTTENRSKILRNHYNHTRPDITPTSLTPEPKLPIRRIKPKPSTVIKEYFYQDSEKIQESGQVKLKRNIKTPFGYDKMGQGSLSIVLEKKLPVGGELLMKSPIKPMPPLKS